MSHLPRISIVTPSYQQAEFLETTLKSVLDQGYENLEYVAVDGGSTDGSVEILERYADHFSWWVSEKDRGQSHAINKGFAQTTGDILGWLNSDDRLEPGALAAVAEAAAANPDAVAFVGHGRLVTPEGEEVCYQKPGDLSFEGMQAWAKDGWFFQPSCFWRRSVWENVGPVEEHLHWMMDVALWLKMVREGRFVPIDRLLSTAILHPEAKTSACAYHQLAEVGFLLVRAGAIEAGHEAVLACADWAAWHKERHLYYHGLYRDMKRGPWGRYRRHRAKYAGGEPPSRPRPAIGYP